MLPTLTLMKGFPVGGDKEYIVSVMPLWELLAESLRLIIWSNK